VRCNCCPPLWIYVFWFGLIHQCHSIMVTFDDNNTKCPKCNQPCSDAYRCKYCNCNMHWFCSTDGSDGSLLGHGAHYVCVSCSKKKPPSTAVSNRQRRSQNSGNAPSIEETGAVKKEARSQNSRKASSMVNLGLENKGNRLRRSKRASSISNRGNSNVVRIKRSRKDADSNSNVVHLIMFHPRVDT